MASRVPGSSSHTSSTGATSSGRFDACSASSADYRSGMRTAVGETPADRHSHVILTSPSGFGHTQ